MATEGESGTFVAPRDFTILQKWIDEFSLPAKNIHYINGNLLSDAEFKRSTIQYNIHGVTVFEAWNKPFDIKNVLEFKPKDDRYLYLNYNRTTRPHRIYFLAELLQAGLYEKGLNSFNLLNNSNLLHNEVFNYGINRYDANLVTAAQYIFNKKQEIIDVETTFNLASSINLNDHERTFVDVVTETIVDPNSLFISEKLWKPIIVGKPFMVLGSNNMLTELKRLGFKTFGRWFDETYDYTDTLEKKIKIIIKNLDAYKNKSVEDLQFIRNEMKSICQYNQEHFKNLTRQKHYDGEYHVVGGSNACVKPVLDILYDIYNNW
jgi:hypothetical protein